MDFLRVLGGIGRALIATGVLLLLFVAYQLWGTGLQEARAQDSLRKELAQLLTTTTTVPRRGATARTTRAPAPPPAPEGEAVAVLRIPRIGVDKAVIEGVGVPDLKKAPGHYPATPMPGQPGHAAIAGHRTTYGAPFYRLDELEIGDEMLVTTRQGEFRYVIDRIQVVRPSQTEVLAPTEEARLSLTTCEPRFSASKRLVASGVLRGRPAAAPPTTTVAPGVDKPAPSFESAGLSGDPSARGPALRWGLAAAYIAFISWVAARRWGKGRTYPIAIPAFLLVLFVFYENVARLLPANI